MSTTTPDRALLAHVQTALDATQGPCHVGALEDPVTSGCFDEGIPLGCALYAQHVMLPETLGMEPPPLRASPMSAYQGKEYSKEEVKGAIEEFAPWLSWKVYDVLFALCILVLGRRIKWLREAQDDQRNSQLRRPVAPAAVQMHALKKPPPQLYDAPQMHPGTPFNPSVQRQLSV